MLSRVSKIFKSENYNKTGDGIVGIGTFLQDLRDPDFPTETIR